MPCEWKCGDCSDCGVDYHVANEGDLDDEGWEHMKRDLYGGNMDEREKRIKEIRKLIQTSHMINYDFYDVSLLLSKIDRLKEEVAEHKLHIFEINQVKDNLQDKVWSQAIEIVTKQPDQIVDREGMYHTISARDIKETILVELEEARKEEE